MNNTVKVEIKQENEDYFCDQDHDAEKEDLKQTIKTEIEEKDFCGSDEVPHTNNCYKILNITVTDEYKPYDIKSEDEIKSTCKTTICNTIKSTSEAKSNQILMDKNKNIHNRDDSSESTHFGDTECGLKTASVGNVSKHLKLKRKQCVETYQCIHCSYRTRSRSCLITHFRRKHDETEVYSCEQCSYETNYKPELNRHYQWKHDADSTTFRCGHCQYDTKRKQCLTRHIKMKHSAESPTFKCSYCRYETKWNQSLRRHIKVVHVNKPDSEHQIDGPILCKDEPNIDVSDHTLEPSITTNRVEKILSGLKKIRSKPVENNSGSNDDNSTGNKVILGLGNCTYSLPVIVDSNNIPQPLILLKPTVDLKSSTSNDNVSDKNTPGAIVGEKCEGVPKENEETGRHNTAVITQCGDSKKFRCGFCDYLTGSKSHLSRHQNTEHADAVQATVFCQYCSYKCSGRAELRRHFKLKHDTNTEVLGCEYCAFKTKYKPELNRHYKLKHDQSSLSFVCGFCSYATKRKHCLMRHIKMKHDEGTEQLMCKECDYTTKWKQSLKKHIELKHHKKSHLQSILIKCEVMTG